MYKMFLQLIFISLLFPVYNLGDVISQNDQNVVMSVCDQTSEYNVGDEVRLSDWNGATNGGDYYVIWLELSASW